ncbi:MAG: hypothetical protein R2806_04805 [Saprospiraceae bacterium]
MTTSSDTPTMVLGSPNILTVLPTGSVKAMRLMAAALKITEAVSAQL